jgi:putative endonuclease
MEWFVYIILCDDDSLYTGITTDTQRRFQEHLGSKLRARYFNGRKPLEIMYRETGHDRSSALKREAVIKKLSRRQKQQLIASSP